MSSFHTYHLPQAAAITTPRLRPRLRLGVGSSAALVAVASLMLSPRVGAQDDLKEAIEVNEAFIQTSESMGEALDESPVVVEAGGPEAAGAEGGDGEAAAEADAADPAADATPAARRMVSVIVRPGETLSGSGRDPNQPLVNANFSPKPDSLGFQWDIDQFGRVNDGSNDCFDGGMYLKLDNNQFSGTTPQMTQDGQEYVLSNTMQGLQVTRRIYIDAPRGGARYIEVLHNPTDKPIQTQAAIYSMLGSNAQATATTGDQQFNGGQLPTGEVGVMSVGNGNRPSVLWLLADRRETDRPTIAINGNREYTFTWTITVPPQKTLSLVHFVAQRNGGSVNNVSSFVEPFYKNNRLLDPQIPDDLKSTILNFQIRPSVRGEPVLTPVMELAALRDVERGERDVLMFPDGTRLAGEVQGPTLKVKNGLGEVGVDWADVAVLAGGSGVAELPTRVYLRSGEMLLGEVTADGPVMMKSTNGLEVSLEPAQIDVLFTRASDRDNVRSDGADALVQLQDGQRVAITGKADGDGEGLEAADGGAEVQLHAVTPWGPLDVGLSDVAYLEQVREPQPGHRLVLQDGSQLIVVLRSGDLPMRTLRFGAAPLSVFDVQMIARLRDVAADDEMAETGGGEGSDGSTASSPQNQARIAALQAQLRQLKAIRDASSNQAAEARAASDDARAHTFEQRASSLNTQIDRAKAALTELGVEPEEPEQPDHPAGPDSGPAATQPASTEPDPTATDPPATQPADPTLLRFTLAGENVVMGHLGLEQLEVVSGLGTTQVSVGKITRMERITEDRVDPVFLIEMGPQASLEGRLRLRYLPVESRYRRWEIPTAHLVSLETPEGEVEAKERAAAKAADAAKDATATTLLNK